jgi:hypothetical protein
MRRSFVAFPIPLSVVVEEHKLDLMVEYDLSLLDLPKKESMCQILYDLVCDKACQDKLPSGD